MESPITRQIFKLVSVTAEWEKKLKLDLLDPRRERLELDAPFKGRLFFNTCHLQISHVEFLPCELASRYLAVEKGKEDKNKRKPGAPMGRKKVPFSYDEDLKIIRCLIAYGGQVIPVASRELWEDLRQNILTPADDKMTRYTPCRNWDVLKRRFLLKIKPRIVKYENKIGRNELNCLLARLEKIETSDSEDSNKSGPTSVEDPAIPGHNFTTPQKRIRLNKNVAPDNGTFDEEGEPVTSSGLNIKRKVEDDTWNSSPRTSLQAGAMRGSFTPLVSLRNQNLTFNDNDAEVQVTKARHSPKQVHGHAPALKIKIGRIDAGANSPSLHRISSSVLFSSTVAIVQPAAEASISNPGRIQREGAEQGNLDRGIECANKVLSQLVGNNQPGLNFALATCEYLKNTKKLMDRIFMEEKDNKRMQKRYSEPSS